MAIHLACWLLLAMFLFFLITISSASTNYKQLMSNSILDLNVHCFTDISTPLNRKSFPKDFIFGAASSSFQVEGHANEEGNGGPSIWDTFTQDFPERIAAGRNAGDLGDLGIDFYNRYESDLRAIRDMNMDAFRFSISWSRVIPSGRIRDGVNRDGIEFYNKVINASIAKGLKPFVTIFHWETPQALEDRYGGFLNKNIVNDFKDFAELCFREFGDRVKHWITLNEPHKYTSEGYDSGHFAPGRCSKWIDEKYCKNGNSATEPYMVVHHMLLSHATAVHVYRKKYQASQNGKIGITVNARWYEPYSNSIDDYNAAKRSLDFMLGWILNPLTYGDYPRSMRELVQHRLPRFFGRDYVIIKGSFDFVGLNYYTSSFAANANSSDPNYRRYVTDSNAYVTGERDGILIGPKSGASWQYVYPEGIQKILNHIKDTYKNPIIYITENGYGEVVATDEQSKEEALIDVPRIQFHCRHLKNVLASINDYGVQVKGYFVWSFANGFEFTDGYEVGFGLMHVNFTSNFTREAKLSSIWFSSFLGRNRMIHPYISSD